MQSFVPLGKILPRGSIWLIRKLHGITRLSFSSILKNEPSQPLFPGLIHQRRLLPIKVTAEDGFDDPVVGAGCGANTHPDIDLPFGRNIEVSNYEDLLQAITAANRALGSRKSTITHFILLNFAWIRRKFSVVRRKL